MLRHLLLSVSTILLTASAAVIASRLVTNEEVSLQSDDPTALPVQCQLALNNANRTYHTSFRQRSGAVTRSLNESQVQDVGKIIWSAKIDKDSDYIRSPPFSIDDPTLEYAITWLSSLPMVVKEFSLRPPVKGWTQRILTPPGGETIGASFYVVKPGKAGEGNLKVMFDVDVAQMPEREGAFGCVSFSSSLPDETSGTKHLQETS